MTRSECLLTGLAMFSLTLLPSPSYAQELLPGHWQGGCD
jgi:hypothetical protein